MDIKFDTDTYRFNVRSSCIIMCRCYVLKHPKNKEF